jgi:hypothetical protein
MLMLINPVINLPVMFDLVVVLQVHMIDVNAKDFVMQLLLLHHHHYDHLYLFVEQE